MAVKDLLQRLVPLDDLQATVHRFPLSVICSFTLFIIAILATHDFIDDQNENWIRTIACLGCGFFWFGIARLIAESKGWNYTREMVIALPAMIGLCVLIFTSPLWGLHLAFIVPALHLLIMVAPYLNKKKDDLSFWFFNRVLWFGVLISYAALILFAGGLSAALGAIHILFDVDIDDKVYMDIWIFACLVLGPLYALYWVPRQFYFTEEDCNDPPGLKFIANWISAPMVFIYLLILYAYFIKILVQWEVPNGQLAYMIAGFAGAGILTFLVSWPLRENGSPQLRLFHRVFFPALLIPAAFHAYAVWERVHAYGITEQRYALILSVIFFAGIAIIFSLKKASLKHIPMTLAALFLLASFGPWGATNVSTISQMTRLQNLLEKNMILVNGKVTKITENIPFNDRKSISSILDYLCYSERGILIKDWFTEEQFFAFEDEKLESRRNRKIKCYASSLTTLMGFEYVGYWREDVDSDYFTLSNYNDGLLSVQKYDFFIENQNAHILKNDEKLSPPNFTLEDGRPVFLTLDDKANITIKIGEEEILKTSLHDFIVEARKNQTNNQNLFFKAENEKIAVYFDFSYISGEMKDDAPIVNTLSFDLLFRLKK